MNDVRIAIRKQIEELDTLPPLPEAARQIMELRNHPRPDSTALAKIVELDPSLSAQVIRYARSSLYGYRGNVDSAEAAISRVLGSEMVMNLALGLATAAPFNIPRLGPLGSDAYWRRALQSAVVCQNLVGTIRDKSPIIPSMAYLAGLLHDFGLLVLGHLFPDEYKRLNEEMLDDPNLDLSRRENEVMGVTHAEAGARALRYWDLPDELVVAALKHSDIHYRGLHEEYPHVVVVSRAMLSEDGRDDLESALQPSAQESWFKDMGLSVTGLQNAAEKVLKNVDEMDGIVSRAA
jgi:HD-like signal output (HDOD) protein